MSDTDGSTGRWPPEPKAAGSTPASRAILPFKGTAGPSYYEGLDGARLSLQHERIKALMAGGGWWSLSEIARAIDEPEASISAQLRHLRKPRFGSFRIDKRRRGAEGHGGTWEYRLQSPDLFSFTPRRNWKQRAEHYAHALRKLQALEVDPQKLSIINEALK